MVLEKLISYVNIPRFVCMKTSFPVHSNFPGVKISQLGEMQATIMSEI